MGKTITLTLSLLLLALSSTAQKLSPWLAQQVHQGNAASRLTADNNTAINKQATTIDVLVKLADDAITDEVLNAYCAENLATIGRVHIVRLSLTQVAALAQDDRVLRVEAERAPHIMTDRVPQQIGADKAATGGNGELPQAFTGEGVVIGIVDEGFDYIHPFFRDTNGVTRITWATDYLSDKKYTTTEAITNAQHSSDAATLLHGTHVAGIAAGSQVNDINDVVYCGIAPKADIAEATVDTEIHADGSGLSSVSTLQAFNDIFTYADEQQKPCVINFSVGDAMSFSNNRQLENEAISTLLQKPGRALVVAAGNAGSTMRLSHKTATMDSGGAGVMFNEEEQFGTYFGVELKLLPTQTVTLKYTDSTYKTTKGETTATTQQLTTTNTLNVGTKRLTVVNRGETTDGYAVIYLTAGNSTFTTSERMLVTIGGKGDAWLYADPLCAQLENVPSIENHSLANEGYSIAWPAELDDVIAVGNIAHRLKIMTAADKYARRDSTDLTPYESTKGQGYIARSSSAGPTLTEKMKPDVCAPGVNVISALNNFIDEDTEMEYAGWLISHMDTDWEENYGYSMTLAQTGTSMSAPAVTGTIALWMEADPTLTVSQIKDIIANTSRRPDATMAYPNNLYGQGEIDAYGGLLYMLGLTAIDDLSRQQPANVHFSVHGKQLSLHFDGKADTHFTVRIYATDGRLLHTATDQTAIGLHHLPAGIYAVQLNTGERSTTGSTLIRL